MKIAIKLVITIIILVLAGVFSIFVKNSEIFNVNKIIISGAFQYVKPEQIKDIIIKEKIARNLFAVELQSIVRALQSLPWVYKVSVARVWPAKLVIKLTEQRPLALWNENGIITEGGAILYPKFLPKELLAANAIPKFFAIDKHATFILAQYRDIQSSCSTIDLSLSSISINKVKSVRVRLKNGIEVIFGSKDLQTRLNRFILAYDRELRQHSKLIKYIDLQYTNGFAIGWKSGIKRPKVGTIL